MDLSRYISYYKNSNKNFIVENGKLFCVYNKMIVPVGPINGDYSKGINYKRMFNSFPEAVLIRSSYGLEEKNENEWYSVICDEFKSLEEVNSKLRYQIKKGLNNFKVNRISTEFLAENGYDIFINAYKMYRNSKVPNITKKEFYKNIIINKEYEDLFQYWGVFYNDKMVAYAINNIYENIEAEYSVIKVDPEYVKMYPAYALIYSMNKYYLKDKKFKYVNDGFRSLSHDTNIQKFLISKFNFRKQGIGLTVKYKWYLNIMLTITFPFRKIFSKFDRRIGAIYKLEEIRKSILGGVS